MLKNAVLVVVFAASVYFAYNVGRGELASQDTFDYSQTPPWPVWNYVLPFIGRVQRALRNADPPFFRAMSLNMHMSLPPVLYALTQKKIPEMLHDGPKTVAQLASASKSDAITLYRFLRIAAQNDYTQVVRERPPPASLLQVRFRQSAMSDVLREDHPNSMRPGLGHWFEDAWPGVLQLPRLLDEPRVNLMTEAHGVQKLWDYFDAHPDNLQRFDKFMTKINSLSGAAIVDYSFGQQCARVVDVGGGKGGLLRSILEHYPRIQGTLFDLAATIENAKADPEWTPALRKRARMVAGDFFDGSTLHPLQSDPSDDGVTCFTLRNVLHDWDDQKTATILKHVGAVMRAQDRLVIMESLPATYDDRPVVTDIDSIMLLIQGIDRTPAQFEAIFSEVNLETTSIVSTRSPLRVLEGRLRKKNY